MEAEVEVMCFEHGGRGHQPRGPGNLQKLEKARTDPARGPPEKNKKERK